MSLIIVAGALGLLLDGWRSKSHKGECPSRNSAHGSDNQTPTFFEECFFDLDDFFFFFLLCFLSLRFLCFFLLFFLDDRLRFFDLLRFFFFALLSLSLSLLPSPLSLSSLLLTTRLFFPARRAASCCRKQWLG